MSAIKDSVFFPCPACGAREGWYCTSEPGLYSATQLDNPWCHTERLQVLQFAAASRFQGLTLVPR